MRKLFSMLGNLCLVLFFLPCILTVVVILLFAPLIAVMAINTVITTGFSTPMAMNALVLVCALLLFPTLLWSKLRKMYYNLPWLFPYVKIMFVNAVLLMVGEMILNYGYESVDESRHTLFYGLMVAWFIAARAIECYFFHRNPEKYIGGKE